MTSPSRLQHLAWDSEFLGFPVARLITDSAGVSVRDIEEARQTGYQLVYVVSSVDAIGKEILLDAGARLVDRKVTYVMCLSTTDATSTNSSISSTTTWSTQLESLAWQSGAYSRFRRDSRFKPTIFQQLYSLWLQNSLTGVIARQVLVWRSTELQEAGLLTLGEKEGRADIGLLAVDETARGQRGGQQLVAVACAQAMHWGYTTLQVVTQGDNVPACRFYEKCGFTLESEVHIYHLWLD